MQVKAPERTFAICTGEVRGDGLRAVCDVLAVWREGVFAANCTALKVGGLSVQFSRPCGVEVDASGRLEVDAAEDLAVLWRVEGGASGECELDGGVVHTLNIGSVALPDPVDLFDAVGGQEAVAPGGGQV